MITEERYKMLKGALDKGANLAPIDFKNIDEYEVGRNIQLESGDGIEIDRDIKNLSHICCNCGLKHKIKVEWLENSVILKFNGLTKLWVQAEKIGQVEAIVKKQNGEQFKAAYKHAMKVLEDYILVTRDKWTEAKSNESKEHYAMKELFMTTAKRTVEENYKMYLENPKLYNK